MKRSRKPASSSRPSQAKVPPAASPRAPSRPAPPPLGSRPTRHRRPVEAQYGAQYTVRNVPAKADEALRRRAHELGISLNEIVLQAILKEAGLGGEPRVKHHDLDHLAGAWVEDPELDAVLAEQDRIDLDLWK